MPIFTKKYLYLGPLELFKNANLDAHAPVGARTPKFWNRISKLLDLFCPIKKNSTLHPNV